MYRAIVFYIFLIIAGCLVSIYAQNHKLEAGNAAILGFSVCLGAIGLIVVAVFVEKTVKEK